MQWQARHNSGGKHDSEATLVVGTHACRLTPEQVIRQVLGLKMCTMTHSRVAAFMQEGGKASFTDKAKAYAVKAIDHTNAALEGAKQKVRAVSCCNLIGSQINLVHARPPIVIALLDCRWHNPCEQACGILLLCCAIMLPGQRPLSQPALFWHPWQARPSCCHARCRI